MQHHRALTGLDTGLDGHPDILGTGSHHFGSRKGVNASSALMIVVVANIVVALGYITPDRPIRCNHVFPG